MNADKAERNTRLVVARSHRLYMKNTTVHEGACMDEMFFFLRGGRDGSLFPRHH